MGHPDYNLIDTELLRDICGCLLKVDLPCGVEACQTDGPSSSDDDNPQHEDNWMAPVSLAHYTIAEFVLAPRSSLSAVPAVSYFAIFSSGLAREYGMLILQAAIRHPQHPEAFAWPRFLSYTYLNTDACLFLSVMEPKKGKEWTARELRDLMPLVWEFANVNMVIDDCNNLGLTLPECLLDSMERFKEEWNDIYKFVRLTLSGFPKLAAMYVDRLSRSLFNLAARWDAFTLLNDYEMTKKHMPVSSPEAWEGEAYLSTVILQTLNPTKLLILRLGAHRHDEHGCRGVWSEAYGDQCMIETELRRGANPNCSQYFKTPLQLAVERFDNHCG